MFRIRYGAARALCNLGLAATFAVGALGAAAAAPRTLVAFGDSLTQGYGLAPEEGLVPQLQRWLDAKGAEVTVVNAGVSGDTTAGGRARIGWTLAQPADAMIVALGGNDLLRGLPPEEMRANLDAILTEAAAKGVPVLLVGFPAPGNYGEDYRAAASAVWPDLAAAHGVALLPNLLAPITDLPDQRAALADLMQADGLHPNAAGVARVVDQLGPAVLDLLAATP